MQTEILLALLGIWIFFFSSLEPRCMKWIHLKRWVHLSIYFTGRSFEPCKWKSYGRAVLDSPWQVTVCILQTTEGMRVTSMVCKHLLWHPLRTVTTDNMMVAYWWGGVGSNKSLYVADCNFFMFLVTLCRVIFMCPYEGPSGCMRSLDPPTSYLKEKRDSKRNKFQQTVQNNS